MNDSDYTKPDAVQWERVAETSADLGEVPIWCSEESRLYWIDVYEGLLHRTDPESGKTETWSTRETIGCYALTDVEHVVAVALQSGIYRLDLQGGALEKIFDAPYDPARWRFNDGRADRRGRFWVGNMPLRSLAGPQPQGQSSFWRVEGAEMQLGVEGITVANGIAFGPQDDVLYLADRPTWSIQAFDYDIDTGVASNRRTFVHLPEGMGPVSRYGRRLLARTRPRRSHRTVPARRLSGPCRSSALFAAQHGQLRWSRSTHHVRDDDLQEPRRSRTSQGAARRRRVPRQCRRHWAARSSL
jgi:hypothetical protein